ncbi:hypothetical protein G7Z17_g1466 [Cylindrodendrum hubeiense]|uniref:Kinesin light chain n=1 Tax=Cylindrodendrum hubeiense TaxID=595255 RepID=A0A9P5LLE5_9HYPO|nr:hypothetical protein G7Z17_g1466 [Cylindrodendrum hubeiense]
MGSEDDLLAIFNNTTTYCGGLIQCQNTSATLGVSIQVDDIISYLTVDHIFAPNTASLSTLTHQIEKSYCETSSGSTSASSEATIPGLETQQWQDHDDDLEDSNGLWEDDDDEYEFDDEFEDDLNPASSNRLPKPPKTGHRRIQTWEKLTPPSKLDPSWPYLDWSLARPIPQHQKPSQPNAFFLDGFQAKPTVLDRVRDSPRGHLLPVKMVSAIRGVVSGRILYGSSFLARRVCIEHVEDDISALPGSVDSPEESDQVSDQQLTLREESQSKEKDLAMQLKELTLRRSALGSDHPDTVASMEKLALIFENQRNYKEAEGIHRQILAVLCKVSGPEHPITLAKMNSLALVLKVQGEYIEAKRMLKQILELRQTILGKEHLDSLATMNDLALACYDLGDLHDAENMNRQALALRKEILGEEHYDTITSMNNLALVLDSLNRCREAELLNRRVLQLQDKIFGEEHPDTLTSMNNLAVVLDHQGSYDDAKKLLQEIVRVRNRVLGQDHPDTLTSMNNLAIALANLGEHHEAVRLLEDTITLQGKVLGIHHPHTIKSKDTLLVMLKGLPPDDGPA